jgi:16S rRNA (cytosine1407-C5)-methyltransferase
MKNQLPIDFCDRLDNIIPPDLRDSCFKSFSRVRPLTIRINTLKTDVTAFCLELKKKGIEFKTISWTGEGLILPDQSLPLLESFINEGFIYRQSLSSMLPAVILDPRPGEMILDMCAAPGSKTTQMAAMMNNQGSITAIEHIKGRFYKLKSVLHLLSVQNTTVKLMDARRFKTQELFDKILVDVPCSSEGRFDVNNKKTRAYWSLRKIKEMVRKQRGIVLNAARCLKPGGTLLYSTCTFAPEENEGVMDWLLKKCDGSLSVEPIRINGIAAYPAVTQWQERTFNHQVKQCFRVLPAGDMDGFFLAKLIKR